MRYFVLILIWINVFALSAKSHIAPSTDVRDSLVRYAKTLINTPYRSGSKGPSGFDCSGFTGYVYSKFGMPLKSSSGSQVNDGEEVGVEQLKKGDLVFFKGRNSKKSRIGHVGIFLSRNDDGSFNFIHSANGSGVCISNSNEPYYSRRFVTACSVLPEKKLYKFTPIQVEAAPIFDESKEYASNNTVHKVKKGESLYSIAKEYKITEEQLKEWNAISTNKLKPGQELTIRSTSSKTAKKQIETTVMHEHSSNPAQNIHVVKQGESFYSIAKKYKISEEELKHLNNYRDGKLHIGDELTIPANDEVSTSESNNQTVTKTIASHQTHKVKKGETLSSIAEKYGTTTSQLKKWNGITKNKLKPGTVLTVKVTEKEIEVKQKTESSSIASKKEKSNVPETEEQTQTTTSRRTHKVKKGETLSSIAEKYGTTTSQLKKWNGIAKNKLKPGTVLTVKVIEKENQNNQKTEKKEESPSKVSEKGKNNVPEAEKQQTISSRRTHKVKKGETLSSIAEKYGTSTSQLKQWNGIAKNKLKPGTVLTVKVIEKKIATAPSSETVEKQPLTPLVAQSNNQSETTHQVKSGETLYSIAKQYQLTTEQLKQWNNLVDNQVKEGDVLSLQPSENKTIKEAEISKPETEKQPVAPSLVAVEQDTSAAKIDTLSTSYTLNQTHIVQEGETLESIANQYKVTTSQIKQWNGIAKKRNAVTPGQKLTIQTVKKEYVLVASKKRSPKTAKKTDKKTPIVSSTNRQKTQDPSKYTVKKGETLYSIAKDNNLTVEQLAEYNRLSSPDVKENQILTLVPDSSTSVSSNSSVKTTHIDYVVKPGDTIQSIAREHNITPEELQKSNDLGVTDLNIGQHLIIPVH